jgi:hypothetical protein
MALLVPLLDGAWVTATPLYHLLLVPFPIDVVLLVPLIDGAWVR